MILFLQYEYSTTIAAHQYELQYCTTVLYSTSTTWYNRAGGVPVFTVHPGAPKTEHTYVAYEIPVDTRRDSFKK